MSATGRKQNSDRSDPETGSDWPRKAIGLPAYLVKDWGTTLRTALLVGVGRLTAESFGAPDALTHQVVRVFETVQLSGDWLPWSMVACVGSAEAARLARAALGRRASSGPSASPAEPEGTEAETAGTAKNNGGKKRGESTAAKSTRKKSADQPSGGAKPDQKKDGKRSSGAGARKSVPVSAK